MYNDLHEEILRLRLRLSDLAQRTRSERNSAKGEAKRLMRKLNDEIEEASNTMRRALEIVQEFDES